MILFGQAKEVAAVASKCGVSVEAVAIFRPCAGSTDELHRTLRAICWETGCKPISKRELRALPARPKRRTAGLVDMRDLVARIMAMAS